MTFMGCTVHLIDWLHGVLVLPDLDTDRGPGRLKDGVLGPWSLWTPEGEVRLEREATPPIPKDELELVRGQLQEVRTGFVAWLRRAVGIDRPFVRPESRRERRRRQQEEH